MGITDHIRSHISSRLSSKQSLVVYDPDERYRGVVESMTTDGIIIVDASAGTISGREQAMRCWREIAEKPQGTASLLVYVPAPKPSTDENKQRDPFQPFAIGGAVFPATDADAYEELCVAAMPEHAEQVRQLFKDDPSPSFATIDALDSGATWPKLRTILGVESNREILVALLSPTEEQRQRLEDDGAWPGEYRQFAEAVLGWKPAPRLRKFESIRDDLARFVLFSEFAFDLPVALPANLESVPHVDAVRHKIIREVCDTLRATHHHQEPYVALALQVEEELDLERQCKTVESFGHLDTFRFEEAALLRQATREAKAGNLSDASRIIEERQHSLWLQDDERGAAWSIASYGVRLLQMVKSLALSTERACSSASALVDFYASEAYDVDTTYRSFEQSVEEAYGVVPDLEEFISVVRRSYRNFVDSMQQSFVERCKAGGLPTNTLRQTDVFDAFIAPLLADHQRKVALVMVDSLRFELGADLSEKLARETNSELHVAVTTPPTVTPLGMASLLPDAKSKLELRRVNGVLVPFINDHKVSSPKERLDHVTRIYGDRCAMVDLNELFRGKAKLRLDSKVQLLLVKTTEIDTAGEAMTVGVPAAIREAQKRYLRAVKSLEEVGFDRVVFATDHGFLFFGEQLPGDKITPPSGNWITAKERCMVGSGSPGPASVSFSKEELGLNGEFDQVVVPRTLGAYKTGSTYMHGGMSLQECILPVVVVEPKSKASGAASSVELRIQYRAGKTNAITTRRPVLEISLFQENMFGPEEMEFRLEARAGDEVVGEPAAGPHVDPSTGLVRMQSGSAIKIALKMQEGFEGAFRVDATNPVTGAGYDSLELVTDYVD